MGGVHPPLWAATETTFHSSEKWQILTLDAWDNFDNTGKNLFRTLKNEVRNEKKNCEGGYTPPINASPIKKQQKEEGTLTLHISLNEYAGSIELQKYIGDELALPLRTNVFPKVSLKLPYSCLKPALNLP